MTHHGPNMQQGGYPQQGGFQSFGGAPQQIRPPMPSDNKGWAIATIFLFWPLAFSAFSNSGKVQTLWMQGDFFGAQAASDQVKKLGKIALIIAVVWWILAIVMWIDVFATTMSAISEIPTYSDYSDYSGY